MVTRSAALFRIPLKKTFGKLYKKKLCNLNGEMLWEKDVPKNWAT
jgi:hypothetical protein